MDSPTPLPSAPPATMPPTTMPNVPVSWPGAFGAYKYSKQAVKRNVSTLLVLILGNVVISIFLQRFLGPFGRILAEVISIFISLATYFTYLASVRGTTLDVGDALKKSGSQVAVNYFFNSILTTLIAVVSLALLIVPFFFVFPRILLSGYFVADKQLGPVEAIKASWHATDGHIGKVWGVIGAMILMALLMITIIGIPFALYFLFMYSASLALLYVYLIQLPDLPPPHAAPSPPASPNDSKTSVV